MDVLAWSFVTVTLLGLAAVPVGLVLLLVFTVLRRRVPRAETWRTRSRWTINLGLLFAVLGWVALLVEQLAQEGHGG